MAGDAYVDAKTLTDDEIIKAITHHCEKMGSRPYYIGDEIDRWKADPSCLVVWRDAGTGKLRAYCKGKGYT